MNELQVFDFEGKTLRLVIFNNEPYWIAKDVAEILEYSETEKMTRRLDEDEKTTIPFREDGSNYQTNITIINESGLYNAVLGSNKSEAKRFKKWITSEVLPSIRKTGEYKREITLEEKALSVIQDLYKKVNEQKNIIQEMQPKAEFYDSVADTTDTIDIGQVAKVLNLTKGSITLYEILREEGILMPNNIPYQSYINRGYFKVIEQKYLRGDNLIGINLKTMVYQKGVDFIRRLLKSQYPEMIKQEQFLLFS